MTITRRDMCVAQVLAGSLFLGASAFEMVHAGDENTLTIDVKLDDHFPAGEKQNMYFYYYGDNNQINEPIGDGLSFTVSEAVGAMMWMYWSESGPLTEEHPPTNPPASMDYAYRIQLIELTFNGASPSNTCDISCVAYYGLPVELYWGPTNGSATGQGHRASFGTNSDADIRKKLLATANAGQASDVNIAADDGSFLRIVSPAIKEYATDYRIYYPDPTPYVDSIKVNHGDAVWPSKITTALPNSTGGTQTCFLPPSHLYSFTANLITNGTGPDDWTHIQLSGSLGDGKTPGLNWPIITGTVGNESCSSHDAVAHSDTITLTLSKANFTEFFYTQNTDIWTASANGTSIDLTLTACPDGTYSAQQGCKAAITSLGSGFSLGMVDSNNSVANVSTDCFVQQWFTDHPGGTLKVGDLSSEEWKRCFSSPSDNSPAGKTYYDPWGSAIFDLSGGTVYGTSVMDKWRAAAPLRVQPVSGGPENHLLISINSITTSSNLSSSSDVNGDGVVDSEDIVALMNELGFKQHDANFDRDIDGGDLGNLLGHWGPYGGDKP